MYAVTAVIDCSALRHNLQQVRRLAMKSRLMAIVKANAYGHGLVAAAQAMQDADCYGVARLSEALALRAGGIIKPILLLEGFVSVEDLPLLLEHNIATVVHNPEQLRILEQVVLPQPLSVWMKLDTGMHRLGVRPEEAEAFYQRLSACSTVMQPVNIMSHFSRADEPESAATSQQIACFDAFAHDKPGQQSLSASGGILWWPEAHLDWVRAGIILYGVAPQISREGASYGLRPAMTLKARLLAIRHHRAGEPVGYGGTWVSQRDTCLGVVGIGYGDGYPRAAPSGTPVRVAGREVPLVGRVSMDMLSVDLGPDATEQMGDEVILWGPDLPVERIAACTGISPYELLAHLTARVNLQYLGEE